MPSPDWYAKENLRLSTSILESDRLQELLSALGSRITTEKGGEIRATACCHGGDGQHALQVIVGGTDLAIRWFCHAHQCETTKHSSKVDKYGNPKRAVFPNLIGLVNKSLAFQENREPDPDQMLAISYLKNFLASSPSSQPINFSVPVKKLATHTVKCTLDKLLSCLSVPDSLYVARKFDPVTLSYFGIGTSRRPLPDDPNGFRLGWPVIPVLDDTGNQLAGYLARNPNWSKDNGQHKWHNSLAAGSHLYALYIARRAKGPYIFCEGPGDALRLHESGYPGAIATFGVKLTDAQLSLFVSHDDCNRPIIIAGDNDAKGKEHAEAIRSKLASYRGRKTDVTTMYPPVAKDFGDTSVATVRLEMTKRGFCPTPMPSCIKPISPIRPAPKPFPTSNGKEWIIANR